MDDGIERSYWNHLGVRIPPNRPKYYMIIDGVKIEVPKKRFFDKEHDAEKSLKEISKAIKSIKQESKFMLDNHCLSYCFVDIESHYCKIFVNFNIIAGKQIVKKISDSIQFDGMLEKSGIRMKCYYRDMEVYDFENQSFKVEIVGEVEL